jgi:hypothetical protein
MGNLDKIRPIAVISSLVVRALTSTSDAIALCMLIEDGGSRARDSTSSIEDPSLTLSTLIRRARS